MVQVGFKAMMNLEFRHPVASRLCVRKLSGRHAAEQVRGLIDWRHGLGPARCATYFVRLSQKRRTGPIMSPSRRIVIDVGDDFEGRPSPHPRDVDKL